MCSSDLCGGEVTLVTRPQDLAKAERAVLPGVGAFGDCMAQLHGLGFDEAVCRHVETGRPLLGICVGMQVLHTTGEEFGAHVDRTYRPGDTVAMEVRRAGATLRLDVTLGAWPDAEDAT